MSDSSKNSLPETQTLQGLHWRHACKAYKAGEIVEREKIDLICEAARLAPTSSGLQPFRLFVVDNQEIKEKLADHSLNPEVMRNCSHIIVFAAWDNYTPERIDYMYDMITDQRGLPRGRFSRYTDSIKELFASRSAETNFAHAAHQSYIALGYAMAQAAELKVTTTPAEGFDHAQVDELLGLDKLGLKSVTLLYLGVQDKENDWLAPMTKVRVSTEEFVTWVD